MSDSSSGFLKRVGDGDQAGRVCPNGGGNETVLPQSEEGASGLRGTVLNVQRFSTHDGPGVRTTVFLKGCSNSCAWCHNPESMKMGAEIQLYPDRCIGCGRCIEVCPEQAHVLEDGEKVFRRERCRLCGRCVEECFAGGLVMAGKPMGVEEVMGQILEDVPYYKHSEGGVTFSGGEPLVQRAFLGALLRRCREEGVHTAIETAGNYPWEWLEPLLADVDLVMYDVKIMDSGLHQEYVGNDGGRIRENLLKVDAAGLPLIVRTPVVGGVNDSDAEIAGIARFLSQIEHLRYYELLTYHPLGESKRQSLGLPVEDRFHAPSKERIAELAGIAREFVGQVRP